MVKERAGELLAGLQSDLEAIYRVEAPLSVSDCVLDRADWQLLHPSEAPEELLVVQNGEDLQVGLFVDEKVVRHLVGGGGRWTSRRLNAHCQAVEGVSHFVYLTHRASLPRPVSQLELEVQAEIDKYVTVLLSLWNEGRRTATARLREVLFDAVSYRPDLSAEARVRYEKANSLASIYCRFLEARFVVQGRIEDLLAELRRMYRLGAGEKLSHVACGVAY